MLHSKVNLSSFADGQSTVACTPQCQCNHLCKYAVPCWTAVGRMVVVVVAVFHTHLVGLVVQMVIVAVLL